ncbi:MAG TPA: hypothetical protein VF290_09435 [Pyrinomonadaceae bacterium]
MFDSDFIANPYKTYNYLRSTAPLHWADKFRTGAWLVTRYADVLTGLHDTRLSSQRSHTLTAALPSDAQSEFATFNEIFSRWMLFLDPPHHSRLRILLIKEFTPNMIQEITLILTAYAKHLCNYSDWQRVGKLSHELHLCLRERLVQKRVDGLLNTRAHRAR